MSFDPIADDANSADPMQQVDGALQAAALLACVGLTCACNVRERLIVRKILEA
jgi:hypothetical protein